jgi:hypothetical protein
VPDSRVARAISPAHQLEITTMELNDYEKRVLAATPGKVLTFLRAAATKLEIRAALFAAGYSAEEQAAGWGLLQQATGYVPGVASVTDDAAARAAIAEVDAWDEPGFRRISAALERLHPEQHAFVFAGLEAAQGVGSLLSVSTMLDRLDELESSPARESTRAADQAAIATLAKRGITPELRSHLRDLVRVAQTAQPPTFAANGAVDGQDAALRALQAWYRDWSETARAVIRRRDYLLMLGLSQRRSTPDDGNDPEPPPAPQPPAPPAQATSPAATVTRS